MKIAIPEKASMAWIVKIFENGGLVSIRADFFRPWGFLGAHEYATEFNAQQMSPESECEKALELENNENP